jgi:hypothetical protein
VKEWINILEKSRIDREKNLFKGEKIGEKNCVFPLPVEKILNIFNI